MSILCILSIKRKLNENTFNKKEFQFYSNNLMKQHD